VPDNMTAAERGAVADRIVGDVAETADPALHERVAALKIAGDIAAGNIGAVRKFLHELQHGLSPWQVEPWQLLQEVADLAIRQQVRQASEASASAPAAVPPPLKSAV